MLVVLLFFRDAVESSPIGLWISLCWAHLQTRVSDPDFEMRFDSNPGFKIWSDPDPVFRTWSDPDLNF